MNETEVADRPSEVIEKLADLPLMTSILPGANVDAINPNGSYPGTLVVSFGPKRTAFNGTISNSVDKENLSDTMAGKASADGSGAKMAVTITYSVVGHTDSNPSRTTVRFVSKVPLTGMLADFAKQFSVLLEKLEKYPAQTSPSPGTLSMVSASVKTVRSALRYIKKTVKESWRRRMR